MSELFPSRRYRVDGGAVHQERRDAEAEAREISRQIGQCRAICLEAAEPVGSVLFDRGRMMTTEGDWR